ncbi:MAG TPA: aminopeptidase P N-terminal domain-containing protein [Candidatus Dependentiae bacterium]|nr:aminopeptidase P N-terminal domain-containing protein [Candidatus Dependentiae bacterium]HRQ62289.1 aminopeptidase P N-terminal domain-containing protein [Candidatus Dependentiae bacterium]
MFNVSLAHDFSIYALRRKKLIDLVKNTYKNASGAIVLFAGFEGERTSFRQESSFYYFSGIHEPGIVLVLHLSGKVSLYIPNCVENRKKWIFSPIELSQENATKLGVDEVLVLGDACTGYQFYPFFPEQEYTHLIKLFDMLVKNKQTIFTLNPDNPSGYTEQRLILNRIKEFIPDISKVVQDISPLVASMRRSKDMHEIDLLYKAVEITIMAQEAAASAIADGMMECEVQASLEYIMIGSCTKPSFPSIVGSGKNSTILHYTNNNGIMKHGDLVVVDIGAEFGNYAADLTRTYPVSGTFTKRQREIYTIVLETQQYIADLAKPGMWLSNKEQPDQSLNHLAKKFIAQRGYGDYFPHGIGHFLGLDVHDVGDYTIPLQEGDVITIEPGIYIPEEQIGIRIEDDYWIVKNGVVCLSEDLPKSINAIEQMVQQSLEDTMHAEADESDIFDDSNDSGIEH